MIEQKLQSKVQPGGLHDIYIPAEERVAREDAGGPVGGADLVDREVARRALRVGAEPARGAVGQSRDAGIGGSALDRAEKLPERDLTLAPHDEIRAPRRAVDVSLGGQAGIVSAHGDQNSRLEGPEELDDPPGRPALEGHDREAHQVGIQVAHQALDRVAHAILDEDQIGHRDSVVRVHVPG